MSTPHKPIAPGHIHAISSLLSNSLCHILDPISSLSQARAKLALRSEVTREDAEDVIGITFPAHILQELHYLPTRVCLCDIFQSLHPHHHTLLKPFQNQQLDSFSYLPTQGQS